MHDTALDAYVTTFVARCDPSAQRIRGRRGLHGAIASAEDSRSRLLVTDDSAYPDLVEVLDSARTGMISVFAGARRCARLVAECTGWNMTTAQAMVCSDLRALPRRTLPDGLTLRRVRRLDDDPRDGVRLEDALALAMRADSGISDPAPVFAEYLRSLPPGFQLFAAVDGNRIVRATSGCGVFGRHAVVIFVNTDPDLRRRGLGQTMTAAALSHAHDAGVEQACLDASDAGRSIYERCGFEVLAPLNRFAAPR